MSLVRGSNSLCTLRYSSDKIQPGGRGVVDKHVAKLVDKGVAYCKHVGNMQNNEEGFTFVCV